jgi:O-methyltransferase involved in polyketide biosynthesis
MSKLPTEIDTSRPHSARMYDYLLGGKDNFAADREAANGLVAAFPSLRTATRENRAFLGRAVRYLAAEAGVRQFLDIGAGLPTARNVHEITQEVAPASRVLYVDNDPLVLAHARALLASGPEGRTAYVHADLRQPQEILADPVTRELLDLTKPVALILVAVLQLIRDEEKPAEIIATLMDALPPGSYLIATHGTPEHDPAAAASATKVFQAVGVPFHLRDTGDFARMAFTDLDLVPPGVVLVSEWRADDTVPWPSPAEVGWYGGVARKP